MCKTVTVSLGTFLGEYLKGKVFHVMKVHNKAPKT